MRLEPAILAAGISPHPEPVPMTLTFVMLQPLVALIAGILILLIPNLLRVIVGLYLILIGVLGLWPHLGTYFTH